MCWNPNGCTIASYGGLDNMTEELQVVSETIEVVTNGTDQMVLVEEDVETIEF